MVLATGRPFVGTQQIDPVVLPLDSLGIPWRGSEDQIHTKKNSLLNSSSSLTTKMPGVRSRANGDGSPTPNPEGSNSSWSLHYVWPRTQHARPTSPHHSCW